MSLAGAGEANDPNCVVATGMLEFLVGSMMDGPVDLPPSVVVSVTNIADLGSVHTYPDIFESVTFSFQIQKFPRPHVAYSNRIHTHPMISDDIRIHSSTQGSSALKCLQSMR